MIVLLLLISPEKNLKQWEMTTKDNKQEQRLHHKKDQSDTNQLKKEVKIWTSADCGFSFMAYQPL